MDDGEFNLSNTIGIGLNIGEQMMLPVANGTEEAELVLQQQQLQRQHEQHLLDQQQQMHYGSNMSMDQQSGASVNNSPETTTNVTCLDNSIGNFYQENTDLEVLNAKLAETTKILDYTPAEETTELLTKVLPEENAEKLIVEELGSIKPRCEAKEVAEENKSSEKESEGIDKGDDVKDAEESVDDKEVDDAKLDGKVYEEKVDKQNGDRENAEDGEDAEEVEAEAEDVEADETDGDEDVEEVVEEDEEEIEEEIIPDEVIVPENSQDAVRQENDVKEETHIEECDAETIKDDPYNEDSQNIEDEDESEEPSTTTRRTRRTEEEIDENQCRVCCAKENLVSIFKKIEQRTVAELLMTICPSVSIVIKDFLPQYVCNSCCDNVKIAMKLKMQCETTEKEFRKKLSRHKNKIRRPVGYVVIDAPLDSDPPTDEEPANDEEFKVSDIASATPSEESDSSDFSDSKRRRRGRKRRKSAVVTPTDGKKYKKSKSDDDSGEYEDDGDPIKQKRKRSTNSSPENFDCNECGQSFTRKQSLVLHKRQHTYDRGQPIKCEVCGKKFKIKGAYRTHLEKHKEERRANKCSQCSRRFANSSDLKRHISEEHREKHILPTCSKCNRTFSSAGRLQRHKQNGCSIVDASKVRKPETSSFVVGTDLFKAVAPLQSTYWSDSFSD